MCSMASCDACCIPDPGFSYIPIPPSSNCDRSHAMKNLFPRYSYKIDGQTKMMKQLRFARLDPKGNTRGYLLPFKVRVPEEKGPPVPYSPFGAFVSQDQGSRNYQEDGIMPPVEVSLIWKGEKKEFQILGIFDGHSDRGKATPYLRDNIPPTFLNVLKVLEKSHSSLNATVIGDAWTITCDQLNKKFPYEMCGACLLCICKLDDRIYAINVGDCRALLVKTDGTICQLTEDASLSDRFTRWHLKAGNVFKRSVNGNLRLKANDSGTVNVAREIGGFKNFCCRPKITSLYLGADPSDADQVKVFCEKGDLLVLGTDGLWAAGTSWEVGDSVSTLIQGGVPPSSIPKLLTTEAAARKNSDNVTAMIVTI